jgi:hypothetical protein
MKATLKGKLYIFPIIIIAEIILLVILGCIQMMINDGTGINDDGTKVDVINKLKIRHHYFIISTNLQDE